MFVLVMLYHIGFCSACVYCNGWVCEIRCVTLVSTACSCVSQLSQSGSIVALARAVSSRLSGMWDFLVEPNVEQRGSEEPMLAQPALGRKDSCPESVESGHKSALGPTSWVQSLLDAFEGIWDLTAIRAQKWKVESLCSGMGTPTLGLKAQGSVTISCALLSSCRQEPRTSDNIQASCNRVLDMS